MWCIIIRPKWYSGVFECGFPPGKGSGLSSELQFGKWIEKERGCERGDRVLMMESTLNGRVEEAFVKRWLEGLHFVNVRLWYMS